ncbi:MAG: TFIIB-type zinc finger domain-containing protein [archaeon]
MRKTCPVCNSTKYGLVDGEFRCAKCHFVSKPNKK